MLRKRKIALALLCAALLLTIGALLIYSVFQEQKQPSGGSRFVLADAAALPAKRGSFYER
ncbi:MAG TPA: hypothetical protein PKB13_09250 [Clostridia bacterium]|nr:hypothetical protein [Clostridia bacterium]